MTVHFGLATSALAIVNHVTNYGRGQCQLVRRVTRHTSRPQLQSIHESVSGYTWLRTVSNAIYCLNTLRTICVSRTLALWILSSSGYKLACHAWATTMAPFLHKVLVKCEM